MPAKQKPEAPDASHEPKPVTAFFNRIGRATSRVTGRPVVTVGAVMLIVVWLAVGPIFAFSDTWQLIMNTITSIVTFLMVFLMQSTQTRDTAALQLKLDELIRAVDGAENKTIALDDADEDELTAAHEKYKRIAEGADVPARKSPTRGA